MAIVALVEMFESISEILLAFIAINKSVVSCVLFKDTWIGLLNMLPPSINFILQLFNVITLGLVIKNVISAAS